MRGRVYIGFLLGVLVQCVLVRFSEGHVSLTFPAARKYDLDFLDNSRTKGPCGMPKGEIVTSLLTGSKFNVSWHLGYPHKGGFKLQLLDNLERPVLDLTPSTQGSEFISKDATAQSFPVQLPSDFECNGCTIRLIRQALEWGQKYRFWSCADVDIKPRKEYRETCSKHGRNILGRCKCDRLYYGLHCQYKDECLEDIDCGGHGKCIDVQATTAPRQQCFCQLGWFGPGCNKKSPIRNSEIDFELYTMKEFSDNFKFYWRILKEHKEIEAVMVVNGTGYAGVGWRPRALTKSCKNFPLIEGMSNPSSEDGKAEPEPTSEPDSEPEPNAEPQSEPEPISEPESTSEPTAEHKIESEPSSEPEPTSEPTTTTEKSKYRKSLYSRRSASPTSSVEPEPDVVKTSVSFKVSRKTGRSKRSPEEPISEPEPKQGGESAPEPTSEPNSVPELQADPTSEPQSEPKPTAEPQSEAEPTAVAQSEPEPIGEPITEPEPTAEPKTEPIAVSKPEPEPSIEPQSRAEPISKPEPEPESQPEPESKPEPEPDSKPEPSTEPKSNAEPRTHAKLEVAPKEKKDNAQEPLNPYTPRHDFNPMDCTDMVIGMARGTASRIFDYYTRDRSTPRTDTFWGGQNDLTGALGFEKDGVTTILFRKKLEAKEPTDHSIENELMHVIWAQGQEKGKYVHVPKSGVETSGASVKDFYKPDELKYHGHGKQRGVTTINFLEDETKEVVPVGTGATSDTAENTHCGGEWKTPRDCDPTNYTCEYSAKWEFLPRSDEIKFTITTSHTDKWTGIGFSDNERMSQTDAILGWVEKTGRSFLMDTWIIGYSMPSVDPSQNIDKKEGKIENGATILSFTRKRNTGDPKDLAFTDDKCLFMMFPVKGGEFHSVNKKTRKHEVVPVISSERICIKSCGNDELYDVVSTTESPGLGYNIEFKIVDLGENFIIPEPGSLQYTDLSNSIQENFSPIFRKLPGYRRASIMDLREENKQLVAAMNVQLDKATVEKGRALSDDTQGNDGNVYKILQESVQSGKIGNLKVDPKYLVFEPVSVTSNLIPEAVETKDSFFNFTETKMYIVLGCIAALLLVAIVQASCTIYKTSGSSPKSHKDHLIPNSAWKDYSANTNYAYEAEDKKQVPQLINGKARPENATNTQKSGHRIQRPQGRPPNAPNQPPNMDHTRSLQRPTRGSHHQVNQTDRSTFSLPRTAYDRHRTTPNDMHPDFYFMPSQRKYSGEVVRVYVDYNNQPK